MFCSTFGLLSAVDSTSKCNTLQLYEIKMSVADETKNLGLLRDKID
jgi:hypothetical protein